MHFILQLIWSYVIWIYYKIFPEREPVKLNHLCTKRVGCKFHRSWDSNFYKTLYITPGFTSIDTKNSTTLFGNNLQKNTKACELLCYLANHEILNHIMTKKGYIVPKLEELDMDDYVGEGICYGINKNMGTKSICVKLRQNGKFLTNDMLMTIMIHELTHNDVSNHKNDFKIKQKELRDLYNSRTRLSKITWIDS
jgi:hypothetical protein